MDRGCTSRNNEGDDDDNDAELGTVFLVVVKSVMMR